MLKAVLLLSDVHLIARFKVERTKAQGTNLIFDFIVRNNDDLLLSGLFHTVKGMCSTESSRVCVS